MENSKLISRWLKAGLKPKDFEFFTNRPNLVIGKLPGQKALVEYKCPYCGFYEIKEITLEKNAKGKFKRPRFKCSNCGKTIIVKDLRKL